MRVQLIAYLESEEVTPITPSLRLDKEIYFRTDSRDVDPEKISLPVFVADGNKYFVVLDDGRGYRDHSFTVEWKIGDKTIKHEEITPTTHLDRDFISHLQEIPFNFDDVVAIIRNRTPMSIKVTAHGGRPIE